MERKVGKLPNSSGSFWEGWELMLKIFNDMYLPSKWFYLWQSSMYSKNERFLVTNNLKRIERMMEKITNQLYKQDKERVRSILNSERRTILDNKKI